MQGQRSSMGSLPDTISFDLNPTAADPNIDQDLFWNNNIQNYAHNMIPEYINSTTNNGSTYLNPTNQAQNLSGWNMGESSSSSAQNYAIRNEQKPEDVPINAITVNGVDLNRTNSQIPYSPLFMQSVGNNTYSQALNLGVEIGENSGTNRQVVEENVRAPSSSPGSGGYFGEEIYSNEGCPLSRKRKAIEGHIGQSSSNASPSYFQPRDRGNEWNNTPGWYHANLGSTTSLENPLLATPQDLLNEIPLPLNVTPNVENSRRNHRTRLSSSPQQGPSPNLVPNGSISGNSNVITYPQSSRLLPLNNLSGTRTPQTRRWARGSSSRTGHSISFGERITRPNDEPDSNNLQRNLLDNPIFVPTNDTRDPPQLPPNWGLSRGTTSENNLSINENVSRSAHPMSNPSGVPHRSAPRYSRRLHEYVRRQLLSSPLPEPVGQNSNLPQQAGSSSQVAPSSGASGNNGDRLSRLRSALLLERQLDSAFGGANSSRGATAGPEGRSRLVSEIRNVLDQMRRGEGLRLEDMVILDQSGFFAMADIHDRHRDMRLDVDNMSYEELLALEERIGNVNTGLSEENIMNRLKQRKFFSIAMGAQSELEPCCICREEYNDGEDIGTVECGHEFHSGCVKQWLMLKNSCPICKTTALNN